MSQRKLEGTEPKEPGKLRRHLVTTERNNHKCKQIILGPTLALITHWGSRVEDVMD